MAPESRSRDHASIVLQEEDAEQPLVVLRKNCRDLGEVLPAARQLIGKSRSTQERGYSVAQITLEAVLIRENAEGSPHGRQQEPVIRKPTLLREETDRLEIP